MIVRFKLFRILFSVIMLVSLHQVKIIAQPTEGWKASKETVERLSKSRPEFNYYEEKVPSYILPGLLLMNNGKEASSKNSWEEDQKARIA